ncbi:pantoate--beta-alanine ligase [Grimontia sp. AD028]|uniref:Pantothenate synthetase n=2 Tax=Grimontia TaxID=246861 RepID=A0A128EU95_9GAMM|nr:MULTISPECIES: pantoate--beta-alanine ligase [Grimontia]KKD60359.1 pantoate--beta-alanine ligase [Grimontia sp. AD028]NGN98152.1 pantoate--beta-alanine ligase [Grimontia sedimenti]CZF78162.1 Pantothenate synthetase [Grimontia marina]
MQVIAEIAPLREQVQQWRREGQRIAFVPTMGHLHDGHLTLVRRARENADVVVVSIFVNPMQFDKADDLAAYPRTLDEDIAKLNTEGVEVVFTPTADIMYPNGMDNHAFVDVPGLSGVLEGASRPGHFKGVATVVSKLFNMVQPDVACFGEKDFQQLAVIKKMVDDLCLPIEIIPVATVREMDGLAMSSRNTRLTVDERQRAPVLAKTLRWISSQMRGGRSDYSELVLDGNDQLRAAGLEPDEIFIRDANTLQPISEHTSKAVILAAAFLSQVRLIDNLTVDLTPQVTDDSEE